MIEVFRDSGFDVRMRAGAGVIKVEFPLRSSPPAISARTRISNLGPRVVSSTAG
jgi:hypothetical protein